jgi:hypothetical protein
MLACLPKMMVDVIQQSLCHFRLPKLGFATAKPLVVGYTSIIKQRPSQYLGRLEEKFR